MIHDIKAFNSIGPDEQSKLVGASFGPLSGYLAGKERGGFHVQHLEEEWAQTFGVKHAIACNSATSGLMAAAFAVDLGRGDKFLCPVMTMSATAAAPMFTGAVPIFRDVSNYTFAMNSEKLNCCEEPKAVFLTHLFGFSFDEPLWTKRAHENGMKIIVDAAQAPFARCNGVLAGTAADIGVYSLNVHKPLQCGEGGICVTNDDDLAARIRKFINHGETINARIGLNLRMPEVCAAIARVQLRRGEEIIADRIKQAMAIMATIGDIPGLRLPDFDPDSKHVYYTIPFLIEGRSVKSRTEFCTALRAEGVPIVEGYNGGPLYRMKPFAQLARYCPVAEDQHDRSLFYFENCAYDPTPEQIEQIGAAFRKAAEAVL
jgi:dTDP-4-amino-4,6-dideoxygalactose transaminase